MVVRESLNIRKLVEEAERVGAVFSRYYYGVEEIPITLEKGKILPYGAYVFVKDLDGLPIIYQLAKPVWFRASEDFEEGLIAAGEKVESGGMERYRCTGVLFGKVREDGEITLPKYPVPPFSDVYSCPEELVRFITEPLTDWKIRIGVDAVTEAPVYLALEPLLRQSLLLTGAQGTGKTTAMLTLIARAAMKGVHFLILDWTGEYGALKDGDYGDKECEPLKDYVKVIPWWVFVFSLLRDRIEELYDVVAHERELSRAVKDLLLDAFEYCAEKRLFPSRENLLKAIDAVRDRRYETTVKGAKRAIMKSKYLLNNEKLVIETKEIRELLEDIITFRVIVVDFTASKEGLPDEFEFKRKVAEYIVEAVWEAATGSLKGNFGCVIVSDEAHRICPEPRVLGGTGPSKIWITLATEGGRNCVPFWLVARRLSLVAKSITVESQQNFFCFNVEDVDRRRVAEEVGETFASLLGTLPAGEAVVKSMGFRKPGSVAHVKFDVVVRPSSAKLRAKDVFRNMVNRNLKVLKT